MCPTALGGSAALTTRPSSPRWFRSRPGPPCADAGAVAISSNVAAAATLHEVKRHQLIQRGISRSLFVVALAPYGGPAARPVAKL